MSIKRTVLALTLGLGLAAPVAAMAQDWGGHEGYGRSYERDSGYEHRGDRLEGRSYGRFEGRSYARFERPVYRRTEVCRRDWRYWGRRCETSRHTSWFERSGWR